MVAYRELARGHEERLQRPETLYSLRQKFCFFFEVERRSRARLRFLKFFGPPVATATTKASSECQCFFLFLFLYLSLTCLSAFTLKVQCPWLTTCQMTCFW